MTKGIFPRIKDIGDTALVSVKVKTKDDSRMFERDEYEFEIESSKADLARLMFKALGYIIEHIFEKKRYKLESLNNCDFVIDELPFGYFVELEGSEENIEKSIRDIGLESCEKINGAYLDSGIKPTYCIKFILYLKEWHYFFFVFIITF